MGRILLGAVLMLAILGGGYGWLNARQQGEKELQALPPPEPAQRADDLDLPNAGDIAQRRGPAPPEATEMTREQRRFARYDRNGDRIITRVEMMSSRSKAFRKLDRNGDNLLTFEEWAVSTSDRFAKADKDGNGQLSPAEFATTKRPPPKRQKCAC